MHNSHVILAQYLRGKYLVPFPLKEKNINTVTH